MSRANPRTTHLNAGIPANSYIKAKAEVKSYEDAATFLGNDREKKLASNTVVHRVAPDAIAVRLYETDIITYYADGTFTADNGGFNTPTTSTRCTQFGPRGWFFYHHKKKLGGRGPHGNHWPLDSEKRLKVSEPE